MQTIGTSETALSDLHQLQISNSHIYMHVKDVMMTCNLLKSISVTKVSKVDRKFDYSSW